MCFLPAGFSPAFLVEAELRLWVDFPNFPRFQKETPTDPQFRLLRTTSLLPRQLARFPSTSTSRSDPFASTLASHNELGSQVSSITWIASGQV